jgi:hypothetical protein
MKPYEANPTAKDTKTPKKKNKAGTAQGNLCFVVPSHTAPVPAGTGIEGAYGVLPGNTK